MVHLRWHSDYTITRSLKIYQKWPTDVKRYLSHFFIWPCGPLWAHKLFIGFINQQCCIIAKRGPDLRIIEGLDWRGGEETGSWQKTLKGDFVDLSDTALQMVLLRRWQDVYKTERDRDKLLWTIRWLRNCLCQLVTFPVYQSDVILPSRPRPLPSLSFYS